MKSPLTPQQALANFTLLTELSARNSYKKYREAVHKIVATVHDHGILGDDLHPTREQALASSLREAMAFISAHYPEGLNETDATVSMSAADGPEVTFHYAQALALLTKQSFTV